MLDYIKECYKNKQPLDQKLHQKAMHLFKEYMLVGGMPQAIVAFAKNGRDFTAADVEKRDILELYRDDIKKGLQTILEGIEKIKSGISICIFPEGTRNKEPDTFLPFHEGSFKLAQKSGCPIVPISINNSSAIFEDHFPKIKKAHVVLEYCKPFYINDLDKEDKKFVGAYAQKIISEAYFRNKEKYHS